MAKATTPPRKRATERSHFPGPPSAVEEGREMYSLPERFRADGTPGHGMVTLLDKESGREVKIAPVAFGEVRRVLGAFFGGEPEGATSYVPDGQPASVAAPAPLRQTGGGIRLAPPPRQPSARPAPGPAPDARQPTAARTGHGSRQRGAAAPKPRTAGRPAAAAPKARQAVRQTVAPPKKAIRAAAPKPAAPKGAPPKNAVQASRKPAAAPRKAQAVAPAPAARTRQATPKPIAAQPAKPQVARKPPAAGVAAAGSRQAPAKAAGAPPQGSGGGKAGSASQPKSATGTPAYRPGQTAFAPPVGPIPLDHLPHELRGENNSYVMIYGQDTESGGPVYIVQQGGREVANVRIEGPQRFILTDLSGEYEATRHRDIAGVQSRLDVILNV